MDLSSEKRCDLGAGAFVGTAHVLDQSGFSNQSKTSAGRQSLGSLAATTESACTISTPVSRISLHYGWLQHESSKQGLRRHRRVARCVCD